MPDTRPDLDHRDMLATIYATLSHYGDDSEAVAEAEAELRAFAYGTEEPRLSIDVTLAGFGPTIRLRVVTNLDGDVERIEYHSNDNDDNENTVTDVTHDETWQQYAEPIAAGLPYRIARLLPASVITDAHVANYLEQTR